MTQLYKITPKNEASIRSVMTLREKPEGVGQSADTGKVMHVITVYKTGHAFRSIEDPVFTEDLGQDPSGKVKSITCIPDVGLPVLNDPDDTLEFEFGRGLDGLYADELRDAMKELWLTGADDLTGLDYFTSDKIERPWHIESTHIRITGEITVDKVDGVQYTNIIESNVALKSKFEEVIPEPPKFGLNFNLQ